MHEEICLTIFYIILSTKKLEDHWFGVQNNITNCNHLNFRLDVTIDHLQCIWLTPRCCIQNFLVNLIFKSGKCWINSG